MSRLPVSSDWMGESNSFCMNETLPSVPGGVQDNNTAPRTPKRTLKAKMVFLGSSNVGKTSLVLRIVRDKFISPGPTIGCAFFTRDVHLTDVTVSFAIWDTAGLERFNSLNTMYYRGAHAALVVYDISNRESFDRAQLWVEELEDHVVSESIVIWLVGNKADLVHSRKVMAQEGQCLADERGLFFTETSAMSGDHVNELLLAVAHRVYNQIEEPQGGQSDSRGMSLGETHGRQPSNGFPSCCEVGP